MLEPKIEREQLGCTQDGRIENKKLGGQWYATKFNGREIRSEKINSDEKGQFPTLKINESQEQQAKKVFFVCQSH